MKIWKLCKRLYTFPGSCVFNNNKAQRSWKYSETVNKDWIELLGLNCPMTTAAPIAAVVVTADIVPTVLELLGAIPLIRIIFWEEFLDIKNLRWKAKAWN